MHYYYPFHKFPPKGELAIPYKRLFFLQNFAWGRESQFQIVTPNFTIVALKMFRILWKHQSPTFSRPNPAANAGSPVLTLDYTSLLVHSFWFLWFDWFPCPSRPHEHPAGTAGFYWQLSMIFSLPPLSKIVFEGLINIFLNTVHIYSAH